MKYKVLYLDIVAEAKEEMIDSQEELVSFLQTLNYLDCMIVSVESITEEGEK